MRGLTKLIAIIMLVASVSTTVQAQDSRTGDYYDPLESANRVVFDFNNYVDIYVLDPLTVGYRYITMKEHRSVVENFLRNLREPLNIVNNLLQGDWQGAYHSTFRMTVNTFAGFAGMLDVAGWEGYEYEYEDLGQTLAVWGVGDGPYVVLPLFGPGSTRDLIGGGIESYGDPFNRWAFNTDEEHYFYKRLIAAGLTQKDNLLDLQRDLRQNSADYYAAIRSIIYQRNQALINDQDPDNVSSSAIPDYDEF